MMRNLLYCLFPFLSKRNLIPPTWTRETLSLYSKSRGKQASPICLLQTMILQVGHVVNCLNQGNMKKKRGGEEGRAKGQEKKSQLAVKYLFSELHN